MDQPNIPVTPPKPVVPLPGAVPPHVRPKLGRNALGCAGIVIVIFALVMSALLYGIALSGIVTIPFFSRFYHGPSITRRIQAPPLTEAGFRTLLEQRFAKSFASTSGSPTVEMSEAELSGALQSVITNALHGQGWSIRTVQMAVRSTDLELYVQIDRGIFHADVVARFTPVIASDGLKFEPVFFQIGEYALPKSFVYPLLGYVFDRDLGAWNLSFGEIRLRTVVLHEGELEFDLERPHR